MGRDEIGRYMASEQSVFGVVNSQREKNRKITLKIEEGLNKDKTHGK